MYLQVTFVIAYGMKLYYHVYKSLTESVKTLLAGVSCSYPKCKWYCFAVRDGHTQNKSAHEHRNVSLSDE